MKAVITHIGRVSTCLALALVVASTAGAQAEIPGITGPDFQLATGQTTIDTPDGDALLIWAIRDVAGGTPLQYPAPTLIVDQGDTVTVELTNDLSDPTSLVFPGQGQVTTMGGSAGLWTAEAPANGGTVTYEFTASQPGTYMYHSGTSPELQIEMGLLGALIVRPDGFDQNDPNLRTAYGHPDTAYDHEYLFLLSEMDPLIHDLVDFGLPSFIDNTTADPVFWFINGRNGIDTLSDNFVAWQPNQPYSALARTRPGEKVLLRLIGGGRDQHAFHPHGNHSRIIARDGRMVSSGPGNGPDLGTLDFTITPVPGATVDAIFDWTGEKLNWDIRGTPADGAQNHSCNGIDLSCVDDENLDCGSPGFDAVTHEYCPDHGKPMPVVLPGLQDMSFGGWWSGSPFLGQFGELPPGEGGLNLNGGLFFMWHSHNEKELTNFDIFPGGMLSFVIIEPYNTTIPSPNP